MTPTTPSDEAISQISELEAQLKIAVEALEYISITTAHNPPLESVELMSELANERLFDISKARTALAKIKGEGT